MLLYRHHSLIKQSIRILQSRKKIICNNSYFPNIVINNERDREQVSSSFPRAFRYTDVPKNSCSSKFHKVLRKTRATFFCRPWHATFIKKRLQHRFFPVKFVKFLWAFFLQKTGDWLSIWRHCCNFTPHEKIRKAFLTSKLIFHFSLRLIIRFVNSSLLIIESCLPLLFFFFLNWVYFPSYFRLSDQTVHCRKSKVFRWGFLQ